MFDSTDPNIEWAQRERPDLGGVEIVGRKDGLSHGAFVPWRSESDRFDLAYVAKLWLVRMDLRRKLLGDSLAIDGGRR